MKQVILVVALVGLALAGILPDSTEHILAHTPNPNDILRQVRFYPLSYCDPVVEVRLIDVNEGWHGDAHDQCNALYPTFRSAPLSRCFYSALGLTRFYTFTVTVNGSPKNFSTAIQVDDKLIVSDSSPDKLDGFEQVSVTFAEKDPSISFALNIVIKNNWDVIKGNPVDACWTRPLAGVWEYRFYFRNVKGRFDYSGSEDNETVPANKDSSYFADVQPVFVVGEVAEYKDFDLEAFKKTPEYNSVVVQLTAALGAFDAKWILNVSISVSSGVNYIRVTVNFQPFLLKQHYEAQYYGSVEKAALLKIDERVFNPNGKSFQDWQEIKEFGSFRAFGDASLYAQSQFTWLRFYTVVSAYSALHLKGRYVRLVYKGLKEYVDPNNQINIVIFIDECGKYFIDRNDFLATHLNSYGRNDWVSLFIQTPEVSKAKFYQHIVKFFKGIYPKFWSANQLVDIKFKDNLHVVKFHNPTHESVSVININDEKVQVLNNFNWILLSNNSPLLGRIENLVRGKNSVSSIIFIQYLEDANGTHFEIGYLDAPSKLFRTCYLLYVPANDVFTDDNSAAFSTQTFGSDDYNNPLPKDLNISILAFLQKNDIGVVAVISYVVLAPRMYAVIAVVNGSRWQIVVNWVDQTWSLVSRQPFNDGYFVSRGVPSASAASCASFIKRLYPKHFAAPFLYVLVETRSVGITLFNRLVLTVGSNAYEVVVSTKFGVAKSHVLQSYSPVLFVRPKDDYGYGKGQPIVYGVPSS
jgi:hypothetical protein